MEADSSASSQYKKKAYQDKKIKKKERKLTDHNITLLLAVVLIGECVSQTEMTSLCNLAWKKNGLNRESRPFNKQKKIHRCVFEIIEKQWERWSLKAVGRK